MRRTVLFAATAALFLFCSTAQAMPTQDPPGSGAARWWPLAHYVGWPTSQKSTFLYVCDRESHGQPHARNPYSGCYGLMQLAPCWWSGKARDHGRPFMFWPVNQLRLALHIYRTSGWGPWSL
jgi:soluble lytic murein transglycosylase-like protein